MPVEVAEAGERRKKSGQRSESDKSLDLHCRVTSFRLQWFARLRRLMAVEVTEPGERRQEGGQSCESDQCLDLHRRTSLEVEVLQRLGGASVETRRPAIVSALDR